MEELIDRKLMVFESNPDFADNSRGLWEYVVANTDFKTFWVVKDEQMLNELSAKGVSCGLKNSELANEMIAQARFLITSSFELAYSKKVNQIHIAAWHGFPLKLIGFFDNATSDIRSFEALKVITTQSDIITATSRLSQLVLSGLFAVDPRKVKETGYPRNDIMLLSDAKDNLKKITDINIDDCKLIFYLPTMRKGLKKEGGQFEENIFNYADYSPDELDSFLEENNAYIFTKVHFADNEFFEKTDFKLPKRLIFLDTQMFNQCFLTIYHIMNAFDALITDYSSVYIDYLLLDKPIIFSCPDLEQYQNDRGFIVDNPKMLMPGPVIATQKELLNVLEDVFEGKDLFKEDRKNKIEFFHLYQDANSSRRLLDEMIRFDKCGGDDSTKEMGRQFFDSNSPLAQYADKLTAEIFYDFGEGFNETNKNTMVCFLKREESSKIIIEVDIPPNTIKVRFDPDHFGRCILRDFMVYIDGHLVNYKVIKGYEKDRNIIFESTDPQILINTLGRQCCKLKIEYDCLDLYSNAGKIITELDKRSSELEKQLLTIYESHSWKLTRPLRKIGSRLKREKNDY